MAAAFEERSSAEKELFPFELRYPTATPPSTATLANKTARRFIEMLKVAAVPESAHEMTRMTDPDS